MPNPIKVALTKANSYAQPDLDLSIFKLMENAEISIKGQKILVKPNLLMAHPLSCTNPYVIAGICKWLLDQNAKIIIADSPAFGSAVSVAQKIGLEKALKPLGLKARNFSKPCKITLNPYGSRPVTAFIAPEALDCDKIISIPRVKAHSQMRLTLAVKNCFGCICGIHKALAHAPGNLTVEIFADRVAALWAALPPVMGFCDGIEAMSGTGPRNGYAYPLKMLGASSSAAALDNALIHILNQKVSDIPLSMAMRRRAQNGEEEANPAAIFPMSSPDNLLVSNFKVPAKLKNISFNPLVLTKSLFKRVWQNL